MRPLPAIVASWATISVYASPPNSGVSLALKTPPKIARGTEDEAGGGCAADTLRRVVSLVILLGKMLRDPLLFAPSLSLCSTV